MYYSGYFTSMKTFIKSPGPCSSGCLQEPLLTLRGVKAMLSGTVLKHLLCNFLIPGVWTGR